MMDKRQIISGYDVDKSKDGFIDEQNVYNKNVVVDEGDAS